MAPRYALSESESGSEPDEQTETTVPSNDALEKALRDAVAQIYKLGRMEELTVKRVRLAAEKALELDEGFFKTHDAWKSKSDQIIKDEVTEQDKATQELGSDEDEAEDKPISPPPKKATLAKRTKPAESSTPRKRQKTSTPETEDDDQGSAPLSDMSEDEVTQAPKRQPKAVKARKPKPKSSKTEKAADSDAAEEQHQEASDEVEEAKAEPNADSESEMSVVLDEEPKPTRKRQKKTETSQKGKKKTPAKDKDADLDPNQAEIKRLQGWLVKCGIRKMWWRELAPFETPKAKIQHLKDMLKDAGMEGRYSLEKARQIREERELKADLEMVQEGAKLWGKESADEEASDSGRPRRRLNRGRKALAFLESEGEESD